MSTQDRQRKRLKLAFLNQLPTRLRSIEESFEQDDWNGIRLGAGQLRKGDTFGYPTLARQARKLEQAAVARSVQAISQELSQLQEMVKRIETGEVVDTPPPGVSTSKDLPSLDNQ